MVADAESQGRYKTAKLLQERAQEYEQTADIIRTALAHPAPIEGNEDEPSRKSEGAAPPAAAAVRQHRR